MQIDPNDPTTAKQIEDLKLIMDIMTQQAILRGQMEGLAAVVEILAPQLPPAPPSAGIAAMVSIAASEWARPFLADMFVKVGGLEQDILCVKVQELGTAISAKGLELAMAHETVSQILADKVSEMAGGAL